MSALFGDFHCPRCGSCYFGTDSARGRRFCKGPLIAVPMPPHVLTRYEGCSFEWDPADDAKYCSDEDPTDPTLPVLPEDDLADSERTYPGDPQ